MREAFNRFRLVWQGARRRSGGKKPLDLIDELTQVKGLRQHRRLAPGDAAMAQSHGRKAGNEHDAEVRPDVIGAAREFDAVQPGHDDIGEQQIDRPLAHPGERRIAVAHGMDFMPGPAQRAGEEETEIVVVLSEENARHDGSQDVYSLAIPQPARDSLLRRGMGTGATEARDRNGPLPLKSRTMEGLLEPRPEVDPPIEVIAPVAQVLPLVLASPHSGSAYPAEFLAASRLDPLTLRRSEDSYVDEIFAAAAGLGAPLLRARFPRAYLDPNREPYELDPAMFEDELPAFVNTRSPRVRVGLGTIARVVATGEDIYARKLRFAEAMMRVDQLYRPYHRALRQLVSATRERFGSYLLIDCHSMPSGIAPGERALRRARTDVVLGDCHGASCHPLIMETAHRCLAAKGYALARNTPYAGGFTTAHYGKPAAGAHCLQIEISRSLYMDERSFHRKAFMDQLAGDMRDLAAALAGIDLSVLAAA
jgi:N-formylglutamate amidohydrolase